MDSKEFKERLKAIVIATLKKACTKLFKIGVAAILKSIIMKIINKAKDINVRSNTNEDVLDFRLIEEF